MVICLASFSEDYPEAEYINTSFWSIRDLVLLKGAMVPWRRKHRDIFMRHFGGVGYRRTLLPILMVGTNIAPQAVMPWIKPCLPALLPAHESQWQMASTNFC